MLTPVQVVGLLVFLAAVGGVYLVTAMGFFRAWLERKGKAAPPSKRRLRGRLAVRILAVVGVLCVLYGRFVEPWWVETTHVRIETAKLPAGTSPIRIVHLSDIHSDEKERLEPWLPELVSAEKPDLIVFTGDSANSPEGIPTFRRCFSKIAAIAPTFAVRGNWDTKPWHGASVFEGTGATELVDHPARLVVRGIPVNIAGMPFGFGSPGRVLAGLPKGEISIFLYHLPDLADEVADFGIDLYCAGHTHGGQIALPFYGAIITLSRFGKRFEAGLYRVKDTALYVNRGIGMEGVAPPVRFCARPEITVIELAPNGP